MAMKKLGEANGIVIYRGKLSEDKTDRNKVELSAHLTPEQRMYAVAQISFYPFKLKGLDLNARRLDRSIQVVERTKR